MIGNLPDWSEDNLYNSSADNIAHITSFVLMLLFSCSGVLSIYWTSFFTDLVDRRLLYSLSIWPCTAASLLDRCFLINFVVSSG